MSKENLEKRRQALAQVRAMAQEQLRESEMESVQALSAYDNHSADLGTDTCQRELEAGLEAGFNQKLEQVQRAMVKLAEGTYGICDRCGRPIDRERLDALAEATLCVNCQEESADVQVSPIENKFSAPDFFAGNIDETNGAVEMTGEDFWQAVAQFGTSDTLQDTALASQCPNLWAHLPEDVGSVESIEKMVDSDGEVLFDRVHQQNQNRLMNRDDLSDCDFL
ncbi:MAG: conjugal transfer protein TraR [Sulfobacillus acidophilus]|uniref:Conjugal transfer protein TraR n=1 Tax=Sulfobacillus acidophilus TaxID=53633 RepID=A0A2T2WKU5_9FIRM|nr:MAG: conjugal transfer protein TraR [Sulfobacillus acidophilus]